MTTHSPNNYFYGDEGEQFSFYRIPRQLFTDPRYKHLPNDAKLLYGMMLDRMCLSARNGWLDTSGRVYIYFTLNEVEDTLNCGHEKAVRLMAELDSVKGVGLIERVKQGQGRPARIYVKRFAAGKPREQTAQPQMAPHIGQTAGQPSEKQPSACPENGFAQVWKPDGNHTEEIYTDFTQQNPSISPPRQIPAQMRWMDRWDCRSEVEDHISYPLLCDQHSPEEVDELVELITDILCSSRPTVRINGEALPVQQVKERFRQLEFDHMGYVLDCLSHNTSQIRNIRAYLLTTLYNAPVTMASYYQAEAQRDMASPRLEKWRN